MFYELAMLLTSECLVTRSLLDESAAAQIHMLSVVLLIITLNSSKLALNLTALVLCELVSQMLRVLLYNQ